MKTPKKTTELAAFKMPSEMREQARQKARAADLTFSQLMRRALKRELEATR
jgi:hypothetical protein